MSDVLNINWASPGPVATRFMNSTAPYPIINGPIGSGKTTAAFMKAIKFGRQQAPSKGKTVNLGDGIQRPVRKFKLATIRDTYRQLHKTTIPSWHKRFPADAGEWVGATDAPCRHRLQFILPDGSVLDFINEFGAIGENSVEDFMRGYEPTAFYLNELDLLARDVYTYGRGRVGRYPDMSEGGPTWHGIIADCNAPEFESWLHQDIFEKTPEERAANGIELFIQPGGNEVGAENKENLPPGYYANQAAGAPEWYRQRMINNRAGYSRSGKPVMPEFKDHLHIAAKPFSMVPGVRVTIGIDPRTFPSAAFTQRILTPSGTQTRVFDELQGDQTMGARRFGRVVADHLHENYPYLRPDQVRGIVDPSSTYGADREEGEETWLEIFSAVSGIRVDPAPSNKIPMRREALKKPLSELIEGEPAILISPKCKLIRTGLNTAYRYKKMNVSGAERFSEDVEKNQHADMCEALEYACLAGGADYEITERKGFIDQNLKAARAAGEAASFYDPLSLP